MPLQHTMPTGMRFFWYANGLILAASGLGCTPAPGPTFPGHPMLTTYTKELALESSAVAYGDGQTTTALGAAVSAFYRPWFGFTGGATFGITKRKHYDTRAMVRLIWPEPLAGRLFPYIAAGATAFFPLARDGKEYERHLGIVYGGGIFAQITTQTRVRFEIRDEWLPDSKDLAHNGFLTLGLVYTAR